MCQVWAGLRFIHEHLILHGDLKPANVLLDTRDTAKLADFGCATAFPAAPWDPCSLAPPPGTPGYVPWQLHKVVQEACGAVSTQVAPEVFAGEVHGPPSDFFALRLHCGCCCQAAICTRQVQLELGQGRSNPFFLIRTCRTPS